MKIREGFVSNSSSTTFVMIGYAKDEKWDVIEFMKRVEPEAYSKIEQSLSVTRIVIKDEDLRQKVTDWLYSNVSEKFEIISDYEGYMYIGKVIEYVSSDSGNDFDINMSVEEFEKIGDEVQKVLKEKEKPNILIQTVAS